MDIHKFIENLKKYLRTTFNYEISNNAIRVYLDTCRDAGIITNCGKAKID